LKPYASSDLESINRKFMKLKSANPPLNFWQRYSLFVLWLGMALSAAGLVAGFVSGVWFPIPGGLIVGGIVLIGLWLVGQATMTQGFWTRRSTEVGTNAIVATTSTLVILALINFLATRYPLRFDFTENQQLTLAPQSQQVAQTLRQPAKVWVFERDKKPADVTLLEDFQRLSSGTFSFEYVDVQAQPALARKFEVKNYADVYLESGERRQLLQNVANERLSEVKLTNALAQLSLQDTPVAYFLQGHGEKSLEMGQKGAIAQAVTGLTDRGYKVLPLNLTGQAVIPDDAKVAIVASPNGKLFEAEVTALSKFLNQGGGVLIALEPNLDPGLKPLFDEWGIVTDNRIAIDPERWVEGLGPVAPLVIDYGDHPIVSGFGQNYTVYPAVRSFEIKQIEGVKATPLLRTSDKSWAEGNLQEAPKWKFDAAGDRKGPLILGIALSRTATPEPPPSTLQIPPQTTPETGPQSTSQSTSQSNENTTPDAGSGTPQPANPTPAPSTATKPPKESRLVVFGDADFFSDGFFQQVPLNGDLFLNSVSWLSQENDSILSIRPKEPQNRTLKVTPHQARVLMTVVAVVPVMGLAASALLWWSRR
jgi:ABC-type uncharacterized transport system involved in gliding motility auxiliary subunit